MVCQRVGLSQALTYAAEGKVRRYCNSDCYLMFQCYPSTYGLPRPLRPAPASIPASSTCNLSPYLVTFSHPR